MKIITSLERYELYFIASLGRYELDFMIKKLIETLETPIEILKMREYYYNYNLNYCRTLEFCLKDCYKRNCKEVGILYLRNKIKYICQKQEDINKKQEYCYYLTKEMIRTYIDFYSNKDLYLAKRESMIKYYDECENNLKIAKAELENLYGNYGS
jgi:hypothetical protein